MEKEGFHRRHADSHYRAYVEKQKKIRPNRKKWSYFMKVEGNPSTHITP